MNGLLYADMLEHFTKTRDVASAGAAVLKQVHGMQWDLLQLMAQVNTIRAKYNITWFKQFPFTAGGPEVF